MENLLNEMSESKNKYKHKKLSFIQKYFEKKVNNKGEVIKIYNILDRDDKKYDKKYKCEKGASSTGNLIIYLRDKYDIILNDDDIVISKKI